MYSKSQSSVVVQLFKVVVLSLKDDLNSSFICLVHMFQSNFNLLAYTTVCDSNVKVIFFIL